MGRWEFFSSFFSNEPKPNSEAHLESSDLTYEDYYDNYKIVSFTVLLYMYREILIFDN